MNVIETTKQQVLEDFNLKGYFTLPFSHFFNRVIRE